MLPNRDALSVTDDTAATITREPPPVNRDALEPATLARDTKKISPKMLIDADGRASAPSPNPSAKVLSLGESPTILQLVPEQEAKTLLADPKRLAPQPLAPQPSADLPAALLASEEPVDDEDETHHVGSDGDGCATVARGPKRVTLEELGVVPKAAEAGAADGAETDEPITMEREKAPLAMLGLASTVAVAKLAPSTGPLPAPPAPQATRRAPLSLPPTQISAGHVVITEKDSGSTRVAPIVPPGTQAIHTAPRLGTPVPPAPMPVASYAPAPVLDAFSGSRSAPTVSSSPIPTTLSARLAAVKLPPQRLALVVAATFLLAAVILLFARTPKPVAAEMAEDPAPVAVTAQPSQAAPPVAVTAEPASAGPTAATTVASAPQPKARRARPTVRSTIPVHREQ